MIEVEHWGKFFSIPDEPGIYTIEDERIVLRTPKKSYPIFKCNLKLSTNRI